MIVALRVLVFFFFFYLPLCILGACLVNSVHARTVCNALGVLPLQASSNAAISKCDGGIVREFEPQCLELELNLELIFGKVFFYLSVSVCLVWPLSHKAIFSTECRTCSLCKVLC